MPYGVILLPERAERLIGYARSLTDSGDPLMTIGAQAPPHVTLLHADCGDGAARRWWAEVATAIPATIGVRFSRLGFSPIPPGDFHVPGGGIYVGLEVVRRAGLEAAHAAAVESMRGIGGTPLTPYGEDFVPHVTLGILRRFPRHEVMLPAELFAEPVPCHPALGRLGPYGTFPRIEAAA